MTPSDPASPAAPASPPETQLRRIRATDRRLVLSSIAATALTFIFVCVVCFWRDLPSDRRIDVTKLDLRRIRNAVEQHRERTGSLPKRLIDVPEIKERWKEAPYDWWGQPYRYEIHGRDFDVISEGSDGKPGGVGLEADFHSRNLDDPIDRRAALAQYIQRCPFAVLLTVAAIVAALTGLYVYLVGRQRSRFSYPSIVVAFLIAAPLMAYVVGPLLVEVFANAK